MAPLNVGVLVYSYQAIDAIGLLDVLGSATKQSAQLLKKFCPVNEDAAAEIEFVNHHIGVSLDPVPLSGGILLPPTCTVDNAPELDILILPGPDPDAFELDPLFAELIRKHVAAGKVLFTNCTGACVAAAAGVLDGKKATVNHMLFGWVKEKYPKVNWTMEKKWIVDGNIWTAGGALAGMDMVAHWIKERHPQDAFTMSMQSLDFEPRDVNGSLGAVPLRYDAAGKQIASHDFKFYE
jgi:transcriptional regulator GlxA family with amidase domain